MRRLTIILLVTQGLLTSFVVLRDYTGGSEITILTIISTLFAFTFTILHAGQNLGWRHAALFIGLTLVIGLSLESIGVATGWVYGPYHYTNKLGPLFLDLVPFAIPAAWTMMLYPAYIIASRVTPGTGSRWRWILNLSVAGAFVMTAWDLVMDPVMVAANHWVWEVGGAYFGVPIHNFVGWWTTAFAIILLFLLISRIIPDQASGNQSNNFKRLAIISYAILGISTVLLAFNNNLQGAALAGLIAMFPWMMVGWWAKGK
jgi:putative membrane protein